LYLSVDAPTILKDRINFGRRHTLFQQLHSSEEAWISVEKKKKKKRKRKRCNSANNVYILFTVVITGETEMGKGNPDTRVIANIAQC